MKRELPRKNTRAEDAYIRDMARCSAFEKVDRGQARVLRPEEFPEPLKRFLRRDRASVRIQLPLSARRRLESLSRATGVPADKLARRWVEERLAREAV